ncbi:MAG: dephospho-CoA kinase [Firmicutes bacterium]|nr:dephospho-CoA kinase [Bacillota bacterium]
MKIIGLTGGIGSGKSTVSAYLSENAGLMIIDADRIAHEITEPGNETLVKIEEVFGSDIIRDDGTLDRRGLAGIVFSSEEKKTILEEITHKAIREEIDRLLKKAFAANEPAVIIDAPLLLESGLHTICDIVWAVGAEKEVRVKRAAARDGITEDEIRARMARQMSDEERAQHADEIIDNSGDKETLYRQIERLIQKYV